MTYNGTVLIKNNDKFLQFSCILNITYVILLHDDARDIYKLEQFTVANKNEKTEIPEDYSDRIKTLRGRLGVTQCRERLEYFTS